MSNALRLVHSTDGDPPLSALERYEIHMHGRGLAPRTIAERLAVLHRLERHAGYPATHVSALQAVRYIGQPGFKPATRTSYYSLLLAWFTWLEEEEGTPNPFSGPDARAPRRPRCEPRPITTDQLRDLLALPLRRKTRAMVLLAAFAGLRVHEIAKIKGEDLDTAGIFIEGKGRHRATVPVHPLITEIAHEMPRRGYWFPARGANREGGLHVRREHVGQTIADAMERASIPNGTAHRLRHWFGTNLVASGADLRTAQTLLRHANLTSTAIYTAVADKSRVEAIDRLTLDSNSS